MENPSRSVSRRRRSNPLALILAGGSGTRLKGLTERRAKPAVPFGGHHRTIDFALSNCINSDIRRIALLTQYKSQSLIRHLQHGWGFLRRELDEFVEVWPAQQRCGERWYCGTADAIHQNRDLMEALDFEQALILAGDHVYAMDYSRMLDAHIERRAEVTVGCIEVPLEDARRSYGVVSLERDGRVKSFVEKPERPQPAPGRADMTLASMGIYVFNREALFKLLADDDADPESTHDFGHSVLPAAITKARVFGYLYRNKTGTGPGYWRDVGTVDAYWSAHMDLVREGGPKVDLFDPGWPIWTHTGRCAPARIAPSARVNAAIIGHGAIVAGEVSHSVVSSNCQVGLGSRIKNSVLLPDVKIGRNCLLDHAVIDSRCIVPDNTVIGGDLFDDGSHGYYISPRGIVLLTRRPTPSEEATATRKVA